MLKIIAVYALKKNLLKSQKKKNIPNRKLKILR